VARSYGHLAATAAAAGRRPLGSRHGPADRGDRGTHTTPVLYTRNPKDLRGLQDFIDIAAIS